MFTQLVVVLSGDQFTAHLEKFHPETEIVHILSVMTVSADRVVECN